MLKYKTLFLLILITKAINQFCNLSKRFTIHLENVCGFCSLFLAVLINSYNITTPRSKTTPTTPIKAESTAVTRRIVWPGEILGISGVLIAVILQLFCFISRTRVKVIFYYVDAIGTRQRANWIEKNDGRDSGILVKLLFVYRFVS